MFPGNDLEMYLRMSSFVGVDIFFFLSGFSLGGRKITGYFDFVKSRFNAVYVKYILFALVSCLYAKWKLKRLFEVIFAVEFIKRGGGSFLWFLPAIMLCYLLFPLYQKADNKAPRITLASASIIWIILGVLITYLTDYKAIFILYMRLPVFLLGFYFSSYRIWEKFFNSKVNRLIWGLSFTVAGGVLVYFFAYKTRLEVPMVDFFYIVGIPLTLGLIMLISFVPEIMPIKWIGKSTLEMYGIQMVFGYKWANMIYVNTGSKLITNIFSSLLVIIVAVVLQYAYSYLRKLITNCIIKQ